VRHPGGGKRRSHDGFQIASSGSRSLGVKAPLGKVKLTALVALGPVTRWQQRLASSAVRARRQAKERDEKNILAHGIVVGPRSHRSGVSKISVSRFTARILSPTRQISLFVSAHITNRYQKSDLIYSISYPYQLISKMNSRYYDKSFFNIDE
jgi:hypothetical protein